jgi:divalent metal cation (Fe/Co/Zn/Cd) transporter
MVQAIECLITSFVVLVWGFSGALLAFATFKAILAKEPWQTIAFGLILTLICAIFTILPLT